MNKAEIAAYNRQYYLNNKEKLLKKNAEYAKNNSDRINSWQAKYRAENKKRQSELDRQYRLTHKDEIRERKKEYEKNRKSKDSLYRLKRNLSRRLRLSLNEFGVEKKSPIFDIVGNPSDIFKHFLKFDIDLSNPEALDGRHVDHICPMSQAKNEEEVLKLSHYSNLRPMTPKGNKKKSGKRTKLAEKMCIKLLGREWID